MDTSLMTELQDRLMAYVSGQITLPQFEEWFVPSTWDAQDTDDTRLIQTRNAVDARIAEYTNRDWTEEELRDLLRPYAETRVIPFSNTTNSVLDPQSANESAINRVSLDLTLAGGAWTLLAPNPQILRSSTDALHDDAERNPREPLVLQA